MTTRSRKLAEADAAGDYHPLPEISLTEQTTCIDLDLHRPTATTSMVRRAYAGQIAQRTFIRGSALGRAYTVARYVQMYGPRK